MTRRYIDIPGTSPYEQTGWHLLTLETRAATANAFLGIGDPPLVLGYNGDIDAPATIDALAAFDAIPDADRRADACIPLKTFGSFDHCGLLGGKNRRLLRGITEDEELLQIVPMYTCELREDDRLPPIDAFRRWTDIFDLRRTPQPWFQFRMKGKRSGLSIERWGMERMSTFEDFVKILSEDSEAWLEVKNRLGSIFALPDQDGWNQAIERVRNHLGIVRV